MRVIQKLELKAGDILVVKEPEVAEALGKLPMALPFKVPIVVSLSGVQKLTRQDLLNLLEQLEQSPEPIVEPAATNPI